jgi:hypothetical protein
MYQAITPSYDPITEIESNTPVQAAAAFNLMQITFPLVAVDFVPREQTQFAVDDDLVPLA